MSFERFGDFFWIFLALGAWVAQTIYRRMQEVKRQAPGQSPPPEALPTETVAETELPPPETRVRPRPMEGGTLYRTSAPILPLEERIRRSPEGTVPNVPIDRSARTTVRPMTEWNAAAWRQAIVASEILKPPIALRKPERDTP